MARFPLLVLALLNTAFVCESIFAKENAPLNYKGRDYRDPTVNPLLARPAQENQAPAKEFVKLPAVSIQGVVWGGEMPSAIIGGSVVRKGDTLPEGIEILDITGTGVKGLYRGKIFNILPQGVVEE